MRTSKIRVTTDQYITITQRRGWVEGEIYNRRDPRFNTFSQVRRWRERRTFDEAATAATEYAKARRAELKADAIAIIESIARRAIEAGA